MDHKERVKRAIEFEGPDRVPCCFAIPDEDDIVVVGYVEDPHFVPSVKGEDEWGCVWETISTKMGEVKGHPLDDWSKLDTYKVPDLASPGRYEEAKRTMETYRNKYILAGIGNILFERMHHLRGLDKLLMDFYLEPEKVDKLADMVMGTRFGAIERWAELGADAVIFWEDWGIQDRLLVNPEIFRHFFLPRYKVLFDRIHSHNMKVFMHSCGYIIEIIDDLIGINLDVLQLDQQDNMGVETLAERFGGKICFFCPVDIQKMSLAISDDEIEHTCRELINNFGKYNGGFIAKNYPDPASISISEHKEKVQREAFRKYGNYPLGAG